MVFKKQNYQSVYEYPKENATVSPTSNDKQMWSLSYLASSSPFSSSTSDSYLYNQNHDTANKHNIDFNALDGFTVSSSSRPFHISQYNTECHTWPTDSEFSWSQIQVRDSFKRNNSWNSVQSLNLRLISYHYLFVE